MVPAALVDLRTRHDAALFFGCAAEAHAQAVLPGHDRTQEEGREYYQVPNLYDYSTAPASSYYHNRDLVGMC